MPVGATVQPLGGIPATQLPPASLPLPIKPRGVRQAFPGQCRVQHEQMPLMAVSSLTRNWALGLWPEVRHEELQPSRQPFANGSSAMKAPRTATLHSSASRGPCQQLLLAIRQEVTTYGGCVAMACGVRVRAANPQADGSRCSAASSGACVCRMKICAAQMPSSYSRHMGTASASCDTTSGGVTTAAMMKATTMK